MTGTVSAALSAAATRLAAAGVETPERDARLLLADALGIDSAGVTPRLRNALPDVAAAAFAEHVAARVQRRPVARIVGRRAFWGRSFEVTPDVLDPRPETETLVATALQGTQPATILDLGVGSGNLLVTLLAEWRDARGLGTDANAAALVVAARNAARHGVGDRAAFLRADWTEGVPGRFELVVSNPPYIPAADIAGLSPEVRSWEPRGALTPGPSGLEAYRRIAAGLAFVLVPGGRALLEFGAGQGPEVAGIFDAAGFTRLALHEDLGGRARVLSLVRAEV